MKVKQLLKKTLLVAAGLCVGANASWADTKVSLYSNNYETASDASAWSYATYAGTAPSLSTGDPIYGKYILTTNDTGKRNTHAWSNFGSLDFTGITTYYIEFDAAFRAGSTTSSRQELAIYAPGITTGTSNGTTFDGYAATNKQKKIFFMQSDTWSLKYYLNEDAAPCAGRLWRYD